MKNIKKFIAAPLLFVAIIAVAFFINLIIPIDFNQYGLRPRSLGGLLGIPTVVFLHGDLSHLFNNSIPLLMLGILLRSYGLKHFINITVALILLSGFLTWIISTSDLIVGASGLVFAYFSYLIAKAVKDKTPITILIAGVVILTYGGLLFSLGHVQEGISWAGHFCGFVSGIVLALYGPKQPR